MQRGDAVRLHPHPRGDVFDLALAGQTGRIDAVEEDFEGRRHIAVVLDMDPGRSIGPRAPAHRFFFAPEELELLHAVSSSNSTGIRSVLVAGIGNIFLGDDAFGVEVIHSLSRKSWPPGVRLADFGIRGYDLAYALMDANDHVILVDAYPCGGAPGTVYVVEPDLDGDNGVLALDGHDMNPLHVLRLARAMGAALERVTLVGCEPATLGPSEGLMGLSPPVEAAVPQAATIIERLIAQIFNAGITEELTSERTIDVNR